MRGVAFGHASLTRQYPFSATGVSFTEFIKSLREADDAPFRRDLQRKGNRLCKCCANGGNCRERSKKCRQSNGAPMRCAASRLISLLAAHTAKPPVHVSKPAAL